MKYSISMNFIDKTIDPFDFSPNNMFNNETVSQSQNGHICVTISPHKSTSMCTHQPHRFGQITILSNKMPNRCFEQQNANYHLHDNFFV